MSLAFLCSFICSFRRADSHHSQTLRLWNSKPPPHPPWVAWWPSLWLFPSLLTAGDFKGALGATRTATQSRLPPAPSRGVNPTGLGPRGEADVLHCERPLADWMPSRTSPGNPSPGAAFSTSARPAPALHQEDGIFCEAHVRESLRAELWGRSSARVMSMKYSFVRPEGVSEQKHIS